jgi:peptide/nickel transport system permease protein
MSIVTKQHSAFGPAYFARHTVLAPDAALVVPSEAPSRPNLIRLPRAVRALFERPMLLLAVCFVALLLVAAIAPGLLVSGDPLDANARNAFEAPSRNHVLGTDENGRDILTRLVYGVRPSLTMGVAATGLGLSLGVALGLAAGLGHRFVDEALMRFVDVLLAFPDILTALIIIALFGRGIQNAILAVGISAVPRYARLLRAQIRAVRLTAYVEAATALGLSRTSVVWRHILPNAIKPVLILAVIGIGWTIAAGASLSFLGLGAPPPAPEWGAMLASARNFLSNGWWLTAAPAFAITFTVLSVTAIGRALLRRSEGKTLS